jgi:hypothetical protein
MSRPSSRTRAALRGVNGAVLPSTVTSIHLVCLSGWRGREGVPPCVPASGGARGAVPIDEENCSRVDPVLLGVPVRVVRVCPRVFSCVFLSVEPAVPPYRPLVGPLRACVCRVLWCAFCCVPAFVVPPCVPRSARWCSCCFRLNLRARRTVIVLGVA